MDLHHHSNPSSRKKALGIFNSGVRRKMIKKVLVAGVALAALFGVTARALAADITINGKIDPGACRVNLVGGVVNFPNLTGPQVQGFGDAGNAWGPAEKTVQLNIDCDVPTRLMLNLADNKSSTKFDLSEGNNEFGYGLGLADTKPIGQYRVDFSKLKATPLQNGLLDPPYGYFVALLDKSISSAQNLEKIFFNPSLQLGFEFEGSYVRPHPVSKVSGQLGVKVYFSKEVIDNLSKTITLNGSSTLNVIYY